MSGAQPGHGKRGSARTLLATNKGSRWFFVFGFEKNQRGNIGATELKALQRLARDLLGFDAAKLDVLVEQSLIEEICHDRQDQNA